MVTGAGGFIGSHLVEALVRSGAQVTAFVRYRSDGGFGLLELLDADVRASLRVVAGDLRDPEALRQAASSQDTVFHLGAIISIPYSYVHPTEVADVNVMGTVNVLNAARASEIRCVVHTSTSEVYGTAQTVPISEQHPLRGQSPYSASKIGADAIAESYHRAFGVPVVTVRPFNTYGPRQSGRAVIPTIIGQALHKDAVSLGSTTPTRDFNYVTDTVAGFMAAANCSKAIGQVVNIGSGHEISIMKLAEKIIQRIGREVTIDTVEERIRPEHSEVFRLVCDSSYVRMLTGWAPAMPLDDGIDRVVDFMKRHPNWMNIHQYRV